MHIFITIPQYMELAYFRKPFSKKTLNISETVSLIKKMPETKVMQNLISYMKCAIRFNVSSTIIVLSQFQKNVPKNSKKLKISKTVNFTKKVHRTKKMQNLILHQTCYLQDSRSSRSKVNFQVCGPAILDAILKKTGFAWSDFGRLLVCY